MVPSPHQTCSQSMHSLWRELESTIQAPWQHMQLVMLSAYLHFWLLEPSFLSLSIRSLGQKSSGSTVEAPYAEWREKPWRHFSPFLLSTKYFSISSPPPALFLSFTLPSLLVHKQPESFLQSSLSNVTAWNVKSGRMHIALRLCATPWGNRGVDAFPVLCSAYHLSNDMWHFNIFCWFANKLDL